jgi:glycosyltransferase involved in cell wall biosynthesis
VPPRDPPALAAAMARFADSPNLIAGMGAASRARAEARYDVHGVNRTILDALDL